MAKIKRTVQADRNPPDLTSALQNINIPRGAFGENVGEAISNLGRSVEFSAQKLGEALARQEERQSIADASDAFKDVPIMASNLFETMKRNPGNLLDFDKTYLAALDAEVEKISQGIENPRTRQRFEEKYLSTRNSMGKQAVTWKSREFIIQGANNNRAVTQNIISAASVDISNLIDAPVAGIAFDLYAEQIATENQIAEAAGFLRDADAQTKSDLESLSLTIADSMVKDQPSQLQQFLADGFLQLKDGDKDRLEQQAASSLKRVDEQAEFSSFALEIAQETGLSQLIDSGNAKDSDIMNSSISDESKEYWMDQYSGVESKIRKAVEQKEILIERDKRLGLAKQKKVKIEPASEISRRITVTNLNDEFFRINEIMKNEEFTAVQKLNENLAFISKVIGLHQNKKIYKRDRKFFLELLSPSLVEMIESKYWEGRDNKDSVLSRIGGAFRGVPGTSSAFKIVNSILGNEAKERNVYADFYNDALANLEFFPVANNLDGRFFAMVGVQKHIEIAVKLEGQERIDYIPKIARNAVIDVMKEIDEKTADIPYDDYYASVGIRVPVEGDTIEPPNAEEFSEDKRPFVIQVDAQGNRAKVFNDGTFEEIPSENSNLRIGNFVLLLADFKNGKLTKDEFIKQSEAIRGNQ